VSVSDLTRGTTRAAPAASGAARPRVRSRQLSSRARDLNVVAALIGLAAIAAVGLVAVVIHLFFVHYARRSVDLTMAGLPRRDFGEWWQLFSWNLRHLIVPLAATGLVWLRGARPSRPALWFEAAVALFVLEEVAVNVLWIGEAVGGYGLAATWWLAPHGPLELAAYATALAIWIQALRRRLTLRLAAQGAGASVAMLAVAAAIETGFR
jgi:hypothetical protein